MQKWAGYQGEKYWHFFFKLRDELNVFITDHNFHLSDRFHDDEFLTRLAYLGDVFSRLNDLNHRDSLKLYSMCRTKLRLWLRSWSSFLFVLTRTTRRSFHHCIICFVWKWTQAYRQCQMWYSEASEGAGWAIMQVLSRNGWHKQLDSLFLSCPAPSPHIDIWTREPHRNCNKRFCENWI